MPRKYEMTNRKRKSPEELRAYWREKFKARYRKLHPIIVGSGNYPHRHKTGPKIGSITRKFKEIDNELEEKLIQKFKEKGWD